jgi:hypothetical protein
MVADAILTTIIHGSFRTTRGAFLQSYSERKGWPQREALRARDCFRTCAGHIIGLAFALECSMRDFVAPSQPWPVPLADAVAQRRVVRLSIRLGSAGGLEPRGPMF